MAKHYLSPDDSRRVYGLTQQRLADWLGLSLSAVAMAEANRRGLAGGVAVSVQAVRLSVARLGEVFNVPGELPRTLPAPPPLPPPPPEADPLRQRLDGCQHRATNLRYELENMRRRAACYEARLVAAPALRAYPGPVARPQLEQSWLYLFEAEALDALRDECGAGPQRLLSARLAGLDLEARLLTETLAALAPPPAPA